MVGALTRFDEICLLTGVACQWKNWNVFISRFVTLHFQNCPPCWNMDHAMANKDGEFLSTWQIAIYFNNNPLVYSVLGMSEWQTCGWEGSSRLALRY